jgi:hypothetical protein
VTKAVLLRGRHAGPLRAVGAFAVIFGLAASNPSPQLTAAVKHDMLSPTALRALAARREAVPGAGLAADDSLLRPSWWHGVCDGASTGDYPGSKRNGADFDGLVSCGPGPNQGGYDHLVQFFPGAWGEFEWECVELSMRWMYQAWGVAPYGANGDTVVANYPEGTAGYPALERISNGTAHEAPQPGDVISVDNADQFGHTEVIAQSFVNGAGDGSLRAITENWASGNDGWVSLSVSDWVVSDGVPGDSVLGWLHNPEWSLQTPVIWYVTPSGELDVKATGTLRGPSATVATGIASAEVVGGQGYQPTPLLAARTTGGELLAGFLAPGNSPRRVAPAAVSYSLSTGSGRDGAPVLAWVTPGGALEAAIGSLAAKPVTLIPTGVSQVVLAPHSAPNDGIIGVLTDSGQFEVAEGDLRQPLSWSTVAESASAIGLAGGGTAPASGLEAYSTGGVLYERQGTSGSFTEVAANVHRFSVATVGSAETPLVAWVTGGAKLYARLGSAPIVHVSNGVASVSVAGGATAMGFPLVSYVNTVGELWAKQGTLSAGLVRQSTSVTSGGGSDLTVS